MPNVVFHRLDHDGVLARLRVYAEDELGTRPEVSVVVLIGSLARGDWSARSDADIVVVVDRDDRRGSARAASYLPSADVGAPVDIFVFLPAEVAAWSPRYRREVGAGIVLYRRPPPG